MGTRIYSQDRLIVGWLIQDHNVGKELSELCWPEFRIGPRAVHILLMGSWSAIWAPHRPDMIYPQILPETFLSLLVIGNNPN
jgi:hypothetical protein